MGVSYNATSNELVRTNTLVKGAIIQIDSTPFKQWYEKHYRIVFESHGKAQEAPKEEEAPKDGVAEKKISKKFKLRQLKRKLEPALENAIKSGRLLVKISSRPGQVGRADGYILEGEELAFYTRKISERKKKVTVAK